MEKQRVFLLDKEATLLLKGCAILMVLLGHTRYIIWGGAGGVALFLLLSGYGIHTSYEQNGLKQYWKRRIQKVWLPYCIVGLFDIIALKVHGKGVLLFTLIGLDFDLIADKTMWYISFIMLWYAVYFCIAWIARNMRILPKRITLSFGMVASMIPFFWLASNNVWSVLSGASVYIVFFPLGVLLSCLREWKLQPRYRYLLWLLLLFGSSAYLFRVYGQMYNTEMALAMAVMMISVTQVMTISGPIQKVLLFFGKYAYPIYLFEGVFLVVRHDWFSAAEIAVAIDLCYFLATIAAAVVFDAAYKRFEIILP